MSLTIGNRNATSGMTKAIYDELYAQLSPPLSGMKAEDFEKVKDGWRKLAYAVSKGVIDHIKANMEIKDVHTKGTVTTAIDINTGTTGGHRHRVTGTETSQDATFDQSDDGTGHIA